LKRPSLTLPGNPKADPGPYWKAKLAEDAPDDIAKQTVVAKLELKINNQKKEINRVQMSKKRLKLAKQAMFPSLKSLLKKGKQGRPPLAEYRACVAAYKQTQKELQKHNMSRNRTSLLDWCQGSMAQVHPVDASDEESDEDDHASDDESDLENAAEYVVDEDEKVSSDSADESEEEIPTCLATDQVVPF
jgi:hypothetical protein